MKKILLYSGGVDSWLINQIWKPDIKLYVNLGTSDSEEESLERVVNSFYERNKFIAAISFKDLDSFSYNRQFFTSNEIETSLSILRKVLLSVSQTDVGRRE